MDYRNFDESVISLNGESVDTELPKYDLRSNYVDATADVLFVTEKFDSSKRTEAACFSSDQTARFFFDSVKEANILRFIVTGAIKNQFETEDEMHMILKMQIESFNPKIVVALGRKAEKMLLKVKDITPGFRWFEVIPHPDFWMTFYSHAKEEYVNILKDIKRKLDLKISKPS